MMRGVLLSFFLMFLAAPGYADDNLLTVDLAQSHVDITTGFDGANISLFGVKEKAGHVAVVIKGPLKDVLVRQKKSVFGIWMNRQVLRYDDVPQFYDFAISDSEENLLDEDTRRLNGIGFSALKFKPKENSFKAGDVEDFSKALLRNKQAQGLFPVEARDIVFLSDTFFKTEFYVPPNVPTGQYVIQTFLIDDGNVIERRETHVKVAQVGFSSNVFQFAHSYSFLYALSIVFIAVIAGWLSNAVRQKSK